MTRNLVPCLLLLAALLAPASPTRADALSNKPPFHQMATYQNMLTLDQIEANWLHDLNMEYIANGLPHYYNASGEIKDKRKALRNYAENLANSKGYRVYIVDAPEGAHTGLDGKTVFHIYARLNARARHVKSELWCKYQQEHKGAIYEYWFLKLWVEGRNYPFRYCEFILTRADSLQAERKILRSSQQFFDNHVIDDDFTVTLHKPDRDILLYSHSYISCPDCCKHIEK